MSNVNSVAGDSADIEIRIQISGNRFQEQRYFNSGKPKPKPKSVPDEHISPRFIVKGSTLMTKFMKEDVLPIFGVPDGGNDYLISLQTLGQPHEIFDQEEMNGKTVSEVGIKNLDALKIIIVHKDYNNWSAPPPPPQRKSTRVTEKQRERQTAAVCNEVKASSEQKREKKKKLEARSERGKAKAASANPMAIPSKKIKIAGEGLRLSDGKKVPGVANGGSAKIPFADLFKEELSSREKDQKAMMRVASVDNCNYTFENCPNEGVTGGNLEIVGYKKVVFLNGIEENKNVEEVIIYNFDVVKNALIGAIEMATLDGLGMKINPTLIAEYSPALFWSLVFEYQDKNIPLHQMLSEVVPKYDWTHLADGRVRKQSAKAMENKRQEMEVAADTMSPAMVVHEALFRQAMSLISKTECSVKEAEMAVKKAQSLLSVQHDSGLDKTVSQTLLGRTWLHLYIKKQLKKPDPPDSMQFLLDVTRDSIFPDLFGSADEEDKTSQDNINGKGQFNSDDNDYEDNDDGSEEDGSADEEDKTSQDNINGKGQFNSDDNDYEDNDDGSEEDKLGNDAILTEADIFLSDAYDTLREEEDKMKTILESGDNWSTADVNGLKFMRQELVQVYILSGINYSIMNNTRGAATCFKCAMVYTDKELENMKVPSSITMGMERLNLQRLSVTASALLRRELTKPAEKMGISIPRASLDNIAEGDEEWDNIIDMGQGDVPNPNYPQYFERANLMLKSVMPKAKMMSENGEIHGKEEFEKVLRLAIGMRNLS